MKTKLFLISVIFNVLIINSQDGTGPDFENFNRYTQTNFSTPEVKAFEKVSLIPNNLSTGKLGLVIPIYTIKAGRLTYPIKISYNSGGIKVDEQASEVGLGWNLSKTAITRQIVDGNDFDNVGTQWLDPVGGGISLNDSEYQEHVDVLLHDQKHRMGYFLKKAENKKASVGYKTIDEMPDLYSLISADGFTTKFYFSNPETAPVELTEGSSIISGDKIKEYYPNPQYDTNILSSLYYFPMYDFGKIEVTSKDGIKYTFEDYDVSISNSYEAPTGTGLDYVGYLAVPQVSSWHISEIEDLLTGDKIEFEYQTYNADPYSESTYVSGVALQPEALIVHESIKTIPKRSWFNANFNMCTARHMKAGYEYDNHKMVYKRHNYTRFYVKNRLVSIKFKGGRVDFDWGANRLDLYNTKILNNISVYSKEDGFTIANKLINRFDFTFDYFDSGGVNYYKSKRLKLESVKEMGKPSYVFSYFNENDYFPEITSNKKDFLGYYNSAVTQGQGSHIVPNLYYYPNQNENSILPFNIAGVTNYPIYGDYSDIPTLSDVKRWSLESIRYPTGARTNLIYELNEINIFNQNVTTSGLRLKSSTIINENDTVRSINYSYINTDGSSSGTLVNPPDYGRPTTIITGQAWDPGLSEWDSAYIYDTFIINQYPKIDADLTNGNYVSYSNVKEEESGNGYTLYSFISNETDPNEYIRAEPGQEQINFFTGGSMCESRFAIRNSAYGLDFYTDNSFKRGKLLSKKIFDVNSNIKQETINVYSENITFESESFRKRFFRGKNTYVNDANDDFENMIDITKTYKKNTHKLIKSRNLDYFNGEIVEVSEDFLYNNIGLLTSNIKHINSNESYINNYKYVNDTDISETGISQLHLINYLSDLVEKDEIYNTNNLNESINGFKKEYSANGFVEKIFTSQKGNPFVREFDFDSYDSRGKPKQFKDKSGKITSLFWSNDLLLARVENATYNSIKNYIQTNNGYNIENCESGNCAQYFSETLKFAFPNAQIYSYAYDSALENAISVTDAKNETFYYIYDSYGRLIHVKDQYGNYLSSNDYNYKQN
ncbi:hypothetical protein [Winogradskyella sp. PC D3.3]